MAKYRRKGLIPRALRLRRIAADNHRCRACGLADPDNLQCDHVVPESDGGATTFRNLQTLCSICNNRKGVTRLRRLPILPPVNWRQSLSTHNRKIRKRRGEFAVMLLKARGKQ